MEMKALAELSAAALRAAACRGLVSICEARRTTSREGRKYLYYGVNRCEPRA